MYETLHAFPLEALFLPTLLIFAITAAVAVHVTRAPAMSLIAALLKAGLFLAYFGYFFDGTFTFKDDLSYLREATLYASRGVGLSNLYDHWQLVLSTSGNHFAYQILGTYAYYVFGPGYFAPVAVNTLLTPFIAWLGSNLAEDEFKFAGAWRSVFFFLVLLDPDIVAWSSFVNLKDILVLFFHVVLLYGISRIYSGRILRGMTVLAPAVLILFFLRFYVPLLFIAAFGLSLLMGAGKKDRIKLIVIGIAALAIFLIILGPGMPHYVLNKIRQDFVNPAYGIVRFLLSPIPLNADRNYAFLEIPSILHWVLFPVAIWGIVTVAQLRTPFSRFFLAYVLVFVALYSVYGELQGPRHRVQINYAWIVLQFAGFLALARDAVSRRTIAPLFRDSV